MFTEGNEETKTEFERMQARLFPCLRRRSLV